MASRISLQDNSVVERRLRPIYDWLDSGNNKKAVQESDKVLKKTPKLHCAKALKALALLRIGKEEDCASLLTSLAEENPVDEATLQAMTLCYRELQQLEKICNLYQRAVKMDPTNEELHTHLFMSYVRIFDFRSQQQSALNLYKLKSKNPYYCWAVMSVILQATRGQGKNDLQKRKVLLSLAERMILKLKDEDKLEAEQEIQLYLMILELQEKYEEALTAIDGPLGTKLSSLLPTLYTLPYLIKLKRWKNINLFCKTVLSECMDRWDVWKEYINSVFQLFSSKSEVSGENSLSENDFNYTVDNTPEKAHEFICAIIENGANNGYSLRAPYLARFELCIYLSKSSVSKTDMLGDTMELFIEYFHKFGHKSCCVSDLKIYLHLLNTDKRVELAAKLLKGVGISATSVPNSEHQMQRHITSLQLSRLCGNHRNLSSEHLQALVTALSLHYQHGCQTYGVNLLQTDLGPSDAYAILASHVLYDLANSLRSSQSLVSALVLLENVLKNSPSNFNAKLLCVKFYHVLGSGIGANYWYDSLDVKHLQLDSLGYLHVGQLYTCGLFTLAGNLYDTTLKFFTSNYKDSSDHLTFSYKFGSFIKLEEFMDFRERLNNSFHYAMTVVDKAVLNIVQWSSIVNLYNADLMPKDYKIEWDELRDNRDVSLYLSWDPERIHGTFENSSEMKQLFQQDLDYLKLRFLLIRTLLISLEVVKSSDDMRIKYVQDIEKSLEEWKRTYLEIIRKEYVPVESICAADPLPSHLCLYLQLPTVEYLLGIFGLFLKIVKENSAKISSDLAKDVCLLLNQIGNKVCSVIKEHCDCQDFLWNIRSIIALVVYSLECYSVATIICLLFNDLLKLTNSSKKGKKKIDSNLKDILHDVCSCLKREVLTLVELLEQWPSLGNFTEDFTERIKALSLSGNGQDSVRERLKSGQDVTFKEVRTVLKSKVKLLNSVFNS